MMVRIGTREEHGRVYDAYIDTDELTDEDFWKFVDMCEEYDHKTGDGKEQAMESAIRFLRKRYL